MGISTYPVLLRRADLRRRRPRRRFVAKYFTGTATRIGGVGLAEVDQETVIRHRPAFSDDPTLKTNLEVGGEYAFRNPRRGPRLVAETGCCPPACGARQQPGPLPRVRRLINEQTSRLQTIRGLFRIRTAEEDGRKPVPLEEVEPPPPSSSASPPAPCPMAPSRARPTRRWRSR